MPITFTEDSWISATIGVKSFRYDSFGDISLIDLKQTMFNTAEGGDAFFYAKIPTEQLLQISRLTQVGFSIVDTNIVLVKRAAALHMELPADVEVIDARPEHHAELQNIAENCFRYSRFHQDPLFPNKVGNIVKRKWVENYCLGSRGAALYVAMLAGMPVGFLAVLTPLDLPSAAIIDLIGVKAEYQRRGIGRALVAKFIERWENRTDQLRVGTQITNQSSLALYVDFGFRVLNSTYVLHAHAKKGTLIQ